MLSPLKKIERYLSKIHSSNGQSDLNSIKEIIHPKISYGENMNLTSTPSVEEIKEAVFQIEPRKSPSLDDYPAGFYQHMCDTVNWN